MNVGQLRKEIDGVADDVPVVAIPKGGQALSDRIPTISAFCVGDRTDSYVGAFAIEIAQTVVDVVREDIPGGLTQLNSPKDVPVGTRRPRDGLPCACPYPQVIGRIGYAKCLNCGGHTREDEF